MWKNTTRPRRSWEIPWLPFLTKPWIHALEKEASAMVANLSLFSDIGQCKSTTSINRVNEKRKEDGCLMTYCQCRPVSTWEKPYKISWKKQCYDFKMPDCSGLKSWPKKSRIGSYASLAKCWTKCIIALLLFLWEANVQCAAIPCWKVFLRIVVKLEIQRTKCWWGCSHENTNNATQKIKWRKSTFTRIPFVLFCHLTEGSISLFAEGPWMTHPKQVATS